MTTDTDSPAPADFRPAADFAPATRDDWRALVDRDLKGAPFEKKLVTRLIEGVALQPLYTADDTSIDADAMPGLAPFTRGSHALGTRRLDVRPVIRTPDFDDANATIRGELAAGATSVSLPLDLAGCDGLDADSDAASETVAHGGLPLATAAELAQVLKGVDLATTPVALRPGAAFVPAAGLLQTVWRNAGVSGRGSFGADPLGALASQVALPHAVDESLALLADLAAHTAAHHPDVTAVDVATTPWHDAGAHRVQELAFAIATGVTYLRALGDHGGLTVQQAARQITFTVSLDAELFPAIAQVRALRRLWARVLEACGLYDGARGMQVHAVTSSRMTTARDPWVNLLRTTVATFAAAVSGCESISVQPFDAAIQLPDGFSRRLARNIPIILQDESHLTNVADPAGGSWFVETLTEQLAREAWELFRTIEREGGMANALTSGRVADWIAPVVERRSADLAKRKTPITGVSEYPNLAEESIDRDDEPDFDAIAAARREQVATARAAAIGAAEPLATCRTMRESADRDPGALTAAAVDAATAGATLGMLFDATATRDHAAELPGPLLPIRLAEDWEALRDASDEHLARTGSRPRAFLATLGPVAVHTTRASWARNLLEAGGIECLPGDASDDPAAVAEAFAASGATVACICSSDELYAQHAAATARELKARGATRVLLAGRPGEHEADWRAAGIDDFIYLGCNALEAVSALMPETAAE